MPHTCSTSINYIHEYYYIHIHRKYTHILDLITFVTPDRLTKNGETVQLTVYIQKITVTGECSICDIS